MKIQILTIVLILTINLNYSPAMEWVTVGNPGNAGELSGSSAGGYGPDRICGGVDYTYRIGKYEVTAAQYTEFLNAVAPTDTYGLYNPSMWSDTYGCKIQRTGSQGNYTYSVASDYANRPVNCVSFWNAARFANWMNNGQPQGLQSPLTTEDGAYTLSVMDDTVTRNANASVFIPSENEWYKAAYYDPQNDIYYDYATRTNVMPSNDLIASDPGNNAIFYSYGYTIGGPYWTTEAGEFENSYSSYGTYDQNGNVFEWNEQINMGLRPHSNYRAIRGGAFSWDEGDPAMIAARSNLGHPSYEGYNYIGFRVASIPEPTTLSILLLGGVSMLRKYRKYKLS